jgi:hypothetical protein
MRRLVVLFVVALFVLSAAAEKPAAVSKISVLQLEQVLAADKDKPDAELAQQLLNMELTERLSTAGLARLKALLPGDKAQEALVALADSSVFMPPPASETPADAAPDAAAAHQMLAHIVEYVNTTVRQLPNLIATRDTAGFEDRPQEDVQGATGLTTLIYLPLHVVSRSSVVVTYRDRQEVLDQRMSKGKAHGPREQGLETAGVFGPILTAVVGDALKGKITWGRWETDASGKEAVFNYSIPKDKSSYVVRFCCVNPGVSDVYDSVFHETAAYHGEIAFEPATGAILRMTVEAEMPPNEVVSTAGMYVEYGPVEIGGKTYTCPVRNVSILKAHTTQPPHGMQMASNNQGPAKTFLNDVAFGQYRRFGSETRILTGDGLAPNQPNGPASADSPYSAPARAPTH